MSLFRRTDNSLVGLWWWTIDRWMLVTIGLFSLVGLVMIATASAPEAEKMALGGLFFVKRQSLFIVLGMALMFALSLAGRVEVKRLALAIYVLSYVLVLLTLLIAPERNGAQRWLSLGGMSLQPSEVLKPAVVVLVAWILSLRFGRPELPVIAWSAGLILVTLLPLALQPDVGQSMLIAMVWMVQLFLAGLPMVWVLSLVGLALAGLGGAYLLLPYVADRIHHFIDPSLINTPTQSSMALDAFRYGGVFGRGPSEGVVKLHLPDAYADYIFAVMGEEFGLAACGVLIILFTIVVVRGLARLMDEDDPFALFAVAGLLSQFGLQAFINMGVNVGLLPPKGMTLPFVSYGGSSMLGLAVMMGFLLALTRRRPLGRTPGFMIKRQTQ